MIDPELLRHFPYFAGIDPETLHAIAAVSEDRKLKSGEELFEEGELATHLFIITRGHVDIVLTLADGKQVAVDAIVPGDLLAWSALIEPYRLRASARARRESRVISIDGPELRRLCQSDPTLGYRMMYELAKVLSHRLDGAVSQVAAAG